MDSISIVLRLLTLFILVEWQFYWWVTEKKADREKPKTSNKINYVERYGLYIFFLPLFLQLLGVPVFLSPFPLTVQVLGFILVVIGIGISVIARINLGTNWTHAASYQIKQEHTLITHGVYLYVRHPIYSGLIFALTGAAMVAQSPIFPVVFLGMLFFGYRAGRREEKLLMNHFGKQFSAYKKKSKMLIPFIW